MHYCLNCTFRLTWPFLSLKRIFSETLTWYIAIFFFTYFLEPGVFCSTAAMRKHIGSAVCRADRERHNISQSHYRLWHLQHHPQQSNKDILYTFYFVFFSHKYNSKTLNFILFKWLRQLSCGHVPTSNSCSLGILIWLCLLIYFRLLPSLLFSCRIASKREQTLGTRTSPPVLTCNSLFVLGYIWNE